MHPMINLMPYKKPHSLFHCNHMSFATS